jgi:hypothetical protein
MAWKRWRGNLAKQVLSEGSHEGVYQLGEVILEQAKNEVPLDEGTLKRSGTVTMNPDGSPEGAIHFGYGQGTGMPAIPYAIRWHENNARFQRGRKSRYLADPYNRLINKLPEFLQRSIRRRLK